VVSHHGIEANPTKVDAIRRTIRPTGKKDVMKCVEVRKLEAHFEGLEFHHVSRDNNVAADVLSKLGSKRALVPAGVFIQDLHKPSIRLLSDLKTSQSDVPPPGSHDILMAEAEHDWCLDFTAYILEKRVPEDKVEREKSSGAAPITSSSAQSCIGDLPPTTC
jgi:hypothetical protein